MGSNCTRALGGFHFDNPVDHNGIVRRFRYRDPNRANSEDGLESETVTYENDGNGRSGNNPPAVLLRRHSHYLRQNHNQNRFILKESAFSSSSLPIVSKIARSFSENNCPLPIPDTKNYQDSNSLSFTIEPESLVHLCLRCVCDNPQCWTRPDIEEVIEKAISTTADPAGRVGTGVHTDHNNYKAKPDHDEESQNINGFLTTEINQRSVRKNVIKPLRLYLHVLPINLYRKLFTMLVDHRLLTFDYLPSFYECWLDEVCLSSYPGLKDNWLEHIIQFDLIRKLDLSGCKDITDDGFRVLAAMGYGKGALCSLNVNSCSLLTDVSVSSVLHALSQTLEELDISKCHQLTDSTLARLVSCSRLRVCKIDGCKQFTSPYLCQLGLLTELEHLSLNMCMNVNDHVISALKPAEGIHQVMNSAAASVSSILVSANNSIDNEDESDSRATSALLQNSPTFRDKTVLVQAHTGTQRRTGLRRLKSLGVGWCNITNKGCYHFTSFPELRRLIISSCPISGKGFSKIFQLVNIEYLEARYCDNIGDSIDGFKNLTQMETLKLDYAKEVRVLPRSMPKLRHLSLSNTAVGDTALMDLANGAPLLEYLNVEATPISGRATREFNKLVNLTHLDVSDTALGDIGLCSLQSLQKLKHLNVFHSSVTNRGIRILSSSCYSKALEELNLDSNHIKDEGLKHLTSLPKLRRLDLFGANVSDAGVKHLCFSPTLEELELCGGKITDEGVRYLCIITSLRRLNISQNIMIGDEGVKCISFSLSKLISLNISLTGISTHGLLELRNVKTLEELTARNLKKTVPASVVAQLLHELPRLWHVLV